MCLSLILTLLERLLYIVLSKQYGVKSKKIQNQCEEPKES